MIRAAREARGWTLVELGERVRASQTTIHNWETGKTRPGLEDINVLCSALALSPEMLLIALDVTLTPPAAARLPRGLVYDLIALTPEYLETAEKVARGLRRDLEQRESPR